MPVPPLETSSDVSGEAYRGEQQQRSLPTLEENKALSNRVAHAISTGELDALDELMAPEIAQEFKEGVAEVRRAFPDYHGTNEIQIAEGDMVANRFVFYGTHQGKFMGIAPTGREVTFTGLSIDRVVDGKIVENWIEGDLEDLLRQIGAVVRAAPSDEASVN
ncbi:MAG: ester cyclase [Actinomycetota bacterium]|nr:ester cyclase [Actinomycetota bacterium]